MIIIVLTYLKLTKLSSVVENSLVLVIHGIYQLIKFLL